MIDRLPEVELDFVGHEDDGYYLVAADTHKWLIEEVKRLRERVFMLEAEIDNLRLT